MTTPSPYPGLRPFQQDETDLFFGRETQIEEMLARLEDRRFLAVVGTSGCGKSSLVRAGLLPALEQGFLSNAKPNWRMAVMNPGSAPFDNLTAALLREAALGRERQHASQAAALLQATLRRGPLGLVEAMAESHLPEGTNLLLVVDQFEEIFRYRKQTQNVNDADAFVSLLLASVQLQQSDMTIYVVITMRSDFIGDCALFTGLPEAIDDSQFLTPRLTRDQYRSAIVKPALVASGQLTPALVNQLLNDLRGEPDQLPVLQHALMRMWTQVSDSPPERTLTLDDYKAVGGLAGALSKHCDEILNGLNTEQQRIAEVMFRALCERSSEQRDTRRPVQLGEVAAIAGVDVEAVIPVVDAFRGAGRNFLMPPLPVPLAAETTLDISHESLIRQWHTLNTWVEAEAESARQYQRLEDVAKRRQQRGGAELWRGVDLENARIWKKREKPTEDWAARYGDSYQLAMAFLEESEAEAAKQAKIAILFKTLTVVVGALLLVIISVTIYAFIQKRHAQ
jgi:energy-coupling factor transporter ATP-binding protein EcfA2